jgi:O-methyltransferase domain
VPGHGRKIFATAPGGADCYLIEQVLMDWSGQDAARLLGNCAASMAEGGTVVAVEMVMAAGNDPSPAKPFDLDAAHPAWRPHSDRG